MGGVSRVQALAKATSDCLIREGALRTPLGRCFKKDENPVWSVLYVVLTERE